MTTGSRRGSTRGSGALRLLALVLLVACSCRGPLRLDPAPAGEQHRLAQRSVLTSDSLSQWAIGVLQLEGLPPQASVRARDHLLRLVVARPTGSHLVALGEVAYALGIADASPGGTSNLVISALATWTALFREEDEKSRFGAEWELARALHNASVAAAVARIGDLPGVAEARLDMMLCEEPVTIDYRWQASAWSPEVFHRFFVADDFRVRGMRNRHRQSGIGGSLLAERLTEDASSMPPGEQRLPPRYQTVAMSAVITEVATAPDQVWPPLSFSLRLVDPVREPFVVIAGRQVPVEADFTAALAHTLAGDRPVWRAGFGGLRDAARWESLTGLYMLEPFDPQRIPVVFVHGLVSSPATWREMINDLWSDPAIRSRFQFWVFMYPTGQPFMVSADALRRSLRETRRAVDPESTAPGFDQMVLVGHSMGGLLSRVLTVEPGEALWASVSDLPFDAVLVDDEDRAMLEAIFFSPPVPEVARVVFIAVPHRGSGIADGTVGRFGIGLIRLPPALVEAALRVFDANPDQIRFSQDRRWPVSTSIQSLSPRSPLLLALAELPTVPGVRTHSIIGRRSGGAGPGGSDGVVFYESAHLPGVDSEVIIAGANHGVPMHPAAMVEVRRILLEHVGLQEPSVASAAPEAGAASASAADPSASHGRTASETCDW